MNSTSKKKELMKYDEDFLYHPRKYNTISLWKDVTAGQWNDPAWQRKNSVRTVDQLKKVIKLSDHQEAEIRRTCLLYTSDAADE